MFDIMSLGNTSTGHTVWPPSSHSSDLQTHLLSTVPKPQPTSRPTPSRRDLPSPLRPTAPSRLHLRLSHRPAPLPTSPSHRHQQPPILHHAPRLPTRRLHTPTSRLSHRALLSIYARCGVLLAISGPCPCPCPTLSALWIRTTSASAIERADVREPASSPPYGRRAVDAQYESGECGRRVGGRGRRRNRIS